MKNNEADDARKNEIYKNKILTVPNVLSAFRLLLVPALAWLYLVRKDYSATAWVLLLSGATDIADGFIARRFGMVSDLGKALDPIADKVLVLSGLIVLISDPYETNVFAQIGTIGMIYGGIGVSIIMAREMVVSSLRMMAAKKGVVLAAEMTGKVKTFFTDVTIIILLLTGDLLNFAPSVGIIFDYIGLACFGISVLLTVYSGISYLIKNKEVFKG